MNCVPHSWQGPKFQEIVNIRLGDGSTRRGQVLEVDGEKAVVQVLDIRTFELIVQLEHTAMLGLADLLSSILILFDNASTI